MELNSQQPSLSSADFKLYAVTGTNCKPNSAHAIRSCGVGPGRIDDPKFQWGFRMIGWHENI